MVTVCKWLRRVQNLQEATGVRAGSSPGRPQLEGAARAAVRHSPEKGARLYLVAAPDRILDAAAGFELQEATQLPWKSSLLR